MLRVIRYDRRWLELADDRDLRVTDGERRPRVAAQVHVQRGVRIASCQAVRDDERERRLADAAKASEAEDEGTFSLSRMLDLYQLGCSTGEVPWRRRQCSDPRGGRGPRARLGCVMTESAQLAKQIGRYSCCQVSGVAEEGNDVLGLQLVDECLTASNQVRGFGRAIVGSAWLFDQDVDQARQSPLARSTVLMLRNARSVTTAEDADEEVAPVDLGEARIPRRAKPCAGEGVRRRRRSRSDPARAPACGSRGCPRR